MLCNDNVQDQQFVMCKREGYTRNGNDGRASCTGNIDNVCAREAKKGNNGRASVRESVVMTMIMRDAHATNLSNVIRQNNDGFFYDYTGQRRKAMEKQLQRLTISTTKTKRDERMAERL